LHDCAGRLVLIAPPRMLKREAAWGDTMGLFNLFGGKKKDEAKAAPKPAEAPVKAAETSAKPVVAASKPSVQIAIAASESGVTQVKLRLKLAASLRAGEHGAAYQAAKDLAAIQAKAGRRVGARIWTAEAERILLACDPA
jgi:hypothetical protein